MKCADLWVFCIEECVVVVDKFNCIIDHFIMLFSQFIPTSKFVALVFQFGVEQYWQYCVIWRFYEYLIGFVCIGDYNMFLDWVYLKMYWIPWKNI